MSKETDDIIDRALAALPPAPADPRFFERVAAVARANLARAPRAGTAAPWAGLMLTLSRAAIPALLASAAVEGTVETITVAEKIYSGRDP